MPEWRRDGRKIVVYAAGGHTRDLFEHPEFRALDIVAVVDAGAAGGDIEGRPILSLAEMAGLTPDLVLVSSPAFHEQILLAQERGWEDAGWEVLDLCEGARDYGALFPLAEAHGLVLDDSRDQEFWITRPTYPARTILRGALPWEASRGLIESFDTYFESVDTQVPGGHQGIADFRSLRRHTLLPSNLPFFLPTLPPRMSTVEACLAFAGLAPGDAVLDLGAYAGISAWHFSRAVGPSGRVLAVEPDVRSLEALRRNVAGHGLANVGIDASAVWEEAGESVFHTEGGLHSCLVDVLGWAHVAALVRTCTLGELLERHGMTAPKFIKMSIEGAELRVLAQALPLLRALRPRLAVQVVRRSGNCRLDEVRDLLNQAGYPSVLLADEHPEGALLLAGHKDEVERNQW
jgi:FkbM family methyltransferase